MAEKQGSKSHILFCYAGLIANLGVLFAGILKNPGIPQIYIDRILKEQMLNKSENDSENKGTELKQVSNTAPSDDIESGIKSRDTTVNATNNSDSEQTSEDSESDEPSLRQRKSSYQQVDSRSKHRNQIKRKAGEDVYCRECNIYTNAEAYHCHDCGVCIEDYDHHCVFFSKCIGGGNLWPFWGSMIFVIVNFVNIAIMLGMSAFNGEGGHKSQYKSKPSDEHLNQVYKHVENIVGKHMIP